MIACSVLHTNCTADGICKFTTWCIASEIHTMVRQATAPTKAITVTWMNGAGRWRVVR